MSSRASSRAGAVARLVLAVAVVWLVLVGITQIPGAIGDRITSAVGALNPFQRDAVDRTGPAVLTRLEGLQEFKAARGYYEVIVDVEPPRLLPGFLSGDRIIYVGKGDVEAVVDFSELDERRIEVSDDGATVSVELPAPTLAEPRLDVKASSVALRDEGLLTRFRGSDAERDAQLKAVDRLEEAARGTGMLLELAEESTRTMLTGLFEGLGYEQVRVSFEAPLGDGT